MFRQLAEWLVYHDSPTDGRTLRPEDRLTRARRFPRFAWRFARPLDTRPARCAVDRSTLARRFPPFARWAHFLTVSSPLSARWRHVASFPLPSAQASCHAVRLLCLPARTIHSPLRRCSPRQLCGRRVPFILHASGVPAPTSVPSQRTICLLRHPSGLTGSVRGVEPGPRCYCHITQTIICDAEPNILT
jgi:hypothetical protein